MKYDLSHIMKKAWEIFRKYQITFSEALHRAWQTVKVAEINAERIYEAKERTGIIEAVNTWSGWRKLGYEVIHGSKALFGTDLIYASKGDGVTYKARFFGASQVQLIREVVTA